MNEKVDLNTITAAGLHKLIDEISAAPVPQEYLYVLGTMGQRAAGVSDKQVIEFFKNDEQVILLDRKGQKWRKGERIE